MIELDADHLVGLTGAAKLNWERFRSVMVHDLIFDELA